MSDRPVLFIRIARTPSTGKFLRVMLLFALIVGSGYSVASAQNYPTAAATEFSDSFRSWFLYADEDAEGTLKLRWNLRDDWTEWEYRIGERFGSIKQKWRNNPNEWEVRGDNVIVRMQTVFNNDFSKWRVTDGTHRFEFRTRYGNRADEWLVRDPDQHGDLQIYSTYPEDPRDWEIVDDLDEEIPFATKVALIFLAIHHSSPNE